MRLFGRSLTIETYNRHDDNHSACGTQQVPVAAEANDGERRANDSGKYEGKALPSVAAVAYCGKAFVTDFVDRPHDQNATERSNRIFTAEQSNNHEKETGYAREQEPC